MLIVAAFFVYERIYTVKRISIPNLTKDATDTKVVRYRYQPPKLNMLCVGCAHRLVLSVSETK
jgi:hypothetical protein